MRHPREVWLLSTGVAIAGEPERFYYEYPILLFGYREQWKVSPLFMQEVQVRDLRPNRFQVARVEPDGIEANLFLLQRQHVPPEELQSIARDLEGPFESFDARVDAAFQAMAIPRRPFPADTPGSMAHRPAYGQKLD
jgi:hypothetical protein